MVSLNKYGYDYFFQSQTSDAPDITAARVVAVHRDLYQVVTQYGESNARLKGSLLKNAVYAEDFPAVGDFVQIRYQAQGDSLIVGVLNRKSKFSRTDYSGHAAEYVKTILEQVVAANFDYVFIMASLNYDFNLNRIQRYLTVARQSKALPVIILTKADLVEDFSQQLLAVQKIAPGVDVVAVSTVTGIGLEHLAEYLKPQKTLVFLGSSGVGKSSLVNALAGEEIMTVNTIREDDSKGRHTTTHRQLIMLRSGVMIIDTPGMRELGMWDVSEGLGEVFGDIETLFPLCKFSDCTHTSEPNCAVLTAIADGKLESARWKNYLQLKREAKFTESKAGYLRNKEQWHKSISKTNKAFKNKSGKGKSK